MSMGRLASAARYSATALVTCPSCINTPPRLAWAAAFDGASASALEFTSHPRDRSVPGNAPRLTRAATCGVRRECLAQIAMASSPSFSRPAPSARL